MNLEHRKSALSTTSFVIFEDMMDCNILIGDSTAANTISVTWDTFNQADRKYSHTFRNEQLLIDAMRNMLRKTNFNDLNEALDDEEIKNTISKKTYRSGIDALLSVAVLAVLIYHDSLGWNYR